MNCSVCGKPTEGNRLLSAVHYGRGKVRHPLPVPAEDLEKRREGREVQSQ